MDQGAIENTRQKGLVLYWQSGYVDQARQSIPRVLARCWPDKSSSEKASSNVWAIIPVTGTLDAVADPLHAQFDTWFSAILYDILDASTEPIRDGCLVMSNVLTSILSHIALSPANSVALVRVALDAVPVRVKKPSATTNGPRKVPSLRQHNNTTLASRTGVYGLHMVKVKLKSDKRREEVYVGQTGDSFSRCWAEREKRRRSKRRTVRRLYYALWLSRLKQITKIVLADLSHVKADTCAHDVLAGVLEAAWWMFLFSFQQDDFSHRKSGTLAFAE